MAKLVVLITTHVEKTLALAEAWQKAGAPGVTLVPSHGFRTLKERSRKLELPHFVNLATILKQVDDTTTWWRLSRRRRGLSCGTLSRRRPASASSSTWTACSGWTRRMRGLGAGAEITMLY
jgi:hypothetical protein